MPKVGRPKPLTENGNAQPVPPEVGSVYEMMIAKAKARRARTLDNPPPPKPAEDEPEGIPGLGVCPVCGSEFPVKNRNQLYCSTGPGSCQRAAAMARRQSHRQADAMKRPKGGECKYCGGIVEGRRLYCKGGACKQAAYRERQRKVRIEEGYKKFAIIQAERAKEKAKGKPKGA